jgi:hypothetical protein
VGTKLLARADGEALIKITLMDHLA